DELAAMGDIALALIVHLRHQRAGRIQNRKVARLCGVHDGLRDAMRAEHRHRAIGDLIELLDKARALALQRVDDMLVVHDLMADIDGLAILLERALDDVDRPDDARAKTARLGKYDTHHAAGSRPARIGRWPGRKLLFPHPTFSRNAPRAAMAL